MAKKTFLKKISLNRLINDSSDKCGIIAGTVRSCNAVPTQYGESLRFKGDFIAEIDDSKFGSYTLYVPSIVEDALYAGLQASGEDSQIQFAFAVGQKENAQSKTGYEWVMEPLLQDEDADPLMNLLDKAKEKTNLLKE